MPLLVEAGRAIDKLHRRMNDEELVRATRGGEQMRRLRIEGSEVHHV